MDWNLDARILFAVTVYRCAEVQHCRGSVNSLRRHGPVCLDERIAVSVAGMPLTGRHRLFALGAINSTVNSDLQFRLSSCPGQKEVLADECLSGDLCIRRLCMLYRMAQRFSSS